MFVCLCVCVSVGGESPGWNEKYEEGEKVVEERWSRDNTSVMVGTGVGSLLIDGVGARGAGRPSVPGV